MKLVSPWYLNTQIIMFNISIPVHTYRGVITFKELTAPWQALSRFTGLLKYESESYLPPCAPILDWYLQKTKNHILFEIGKNCHCFLLLPKQSLPGWLTSPRCWWWRWLFRGVMVLGDAPTQTNSADEVSQPPSALLRGFVLQWGSGKQVGTSSRLHTH